MKWIIMEWELPPPGQHRCLSRWRVEVSCNGEIEQQGSEIDGVNRPFQVFWPNASVSFHA